MWSSSMSLAFACALRVIIHYAVIDSYANFIGMTFKWFYTTQNCKKNTPYLPMLLYTISQMKSYTCNVFGVTSLELIFDSGYTNNLSSSLTVSHVQGKTQPFSPLLFISCFINIVLLNGHVMFWLNILNECLPLRTLVPFLYTVGVIVFIL